MQSWIIEIETECLSYPLWKAPWCTQNVTNSVATRHLSQCHVLWHYICFYYWYIPIILKERKKNGLHVLFLKHIEVSIILLSNYMAKHCVYYATATGLKRIKCWPYETKHSPQHSQLTGRQVRKKMEILKWNSSSEQNCFTKIKMRLQLK